MIYFAQPEAPPESTAAARPPLRWMPLVLALGMLSLAMTATAVIAPQIALRTSSGSDPNYAVIAGTGLTVILLSSLFLAYARRVLGLGLAWLALALLTNALVVAAKFILAPIALYQTTFVLGQWPDVTTPDFLRTLAVSLTLAYAAVIGVVYAYLRRRVKRVLPEGERRRGRRPLLVSLLRVLAFVLGGLLILGLGLELSWYGVDVATATGGAAILVIVAALVTGSAAAWEATRTSISLRNVTVLSAAFWLALAMILVYHAVWVVLMTILVTLWPLKTVSPSGK